MTWLVLTALAASAVIHAIPAVAATGGARVERLYGIPVDDAATVLLMRHRAVLFGILSLASIAAIVHEPLRTAVLLAALISVWSYVLLWTSSPARGTKKLDGVARADIVVGALLLVAVAADVLA